MTAPITLTKKMRAKLAPSEHTEQVLLFQWAEHASGKYPDIIGLFAIPNGGYLLSKAAAGKLKAAGLKKGYPDIGLDVARGRYHGLRIELKRQHSGVVSIEQVGWHNWLRVQDYAVVVCHGWEQARDVIVKYLTIHPLTQETEP